MRLDICQILRCLQLQKRFHLRCHGEMVFLYDRSGLCSRARIRISRTGGDHIESVSQHVRKDDDKDLRRCTGLGKPSAFDCRETFADRIHFYDICAAGQEFLGQILKVFCWDQRFFKQG